MRWTKEISARQNILIWIFLQSILKHAERTFRSSCVYGFARHLCRRYHTHRCTEWCKNYLFVTDWYLTLTSHDGTKLWKLICRFPWSLSYYPRTGLSKLSSVVVICHFSIVEETLILQPSIMSIKKRSVNVDVADLSSSIMTEKARDQSWRRFMNEIANEGAYVPTAHGRAESFNRSFESDTHTCRILSSIEHTANCLTHGCLIVPSIIAAQRLLSRSKTPAQYWSSMIYGNALIFLFSCSTIFHCSCFHPTYK